MTTTPKKRTAKIERLTPEQEAELPAFREVECAACEGHGIVTDEGGIYGVADCRFSRWIDCHECDGAGVVEEEDCEAEIFEMTPRQFAGVATFGLASLASSMLFGIALLHVWRAM